MKVSIAFTSFNHEKFVAKALRCALQQDYPQYELVIHDDGSKDSTPQIIADILAKEVPSHVTVVLAGDGRNHGLHEAFNRVTKACTGGVIVMFSADDISHLNRLRRHVDVYEKFPKVMVVSSEVNQIDSGDKIVPHRKHSKADKLYSYAASADDVYAHSSVLGATMSCRSEILTFFGPLLPNHSNGEDNVYWVRALLLGEIYFISEALLDYRLHPDNHSENITHWDNQISVKTQNRSLAKMKREGLNFKQWELDINRALNAGIISKPLADKIKRVSKTAALRSETIYHALNVSPWLEWLRPSMELLRLGRIDLWVVRFALRLSPQIRLRYWALRYKKMKSQLG